MIIKHTKKFGIYHWDTNETLLVGEADTLLGAITIANSKYKGDNCVEIVDLQGKITVRFKDKNKTPANYKQEQYMSRYVYLYIDSDQLEEIVKEGKGGITVQVKLDDDGVVVDALTGEDENIGSTYKLYSEMGVKVYDE